MLLTKYTRLVKQTQPLACFRDFTILSRLDKQIRNLKKNNFPVSSLHANATVVFTIRLELINNNSLPFRRLDWKIVKIDVWHQPDTTNKYII